jgi:hypothetical protein
MEPYLDGAQNVPTSIAWRYSVKMAAGDAQPRYTARLGLIQHSAYEAGEVYRDWASKQSWFPVPISQRQDIGSWRLRGVPHYYIYLPESGANTFTKHPKDMSREEAQEYVKSRQNFRLHEVPMVMEALPKEIAGLGGVVDLRGWEKWGLWMNPDWWPPRQGEEALRQAIEAIHKAGLHVTSDVMFNELSIHRPKEQQGFGEEGLRAMAMRGIIPDDVAIKDETGQAIWIGPPQYTCNLACPTVSVTFKDTVWTLTRMKEAGFDDVQFDGGGCEIVYPCWNKKHSHPRGYGYWQTQTAKDYYERIRDAIPGSRESGFGFVEEYYNEIRAHSYVGTYTRCEQTRDIVNRLKLLPENRMTPLPDMFSFVYHGRVIEEGFFFTDGIASYTAAANMALGVCAGPQVTPWLTFRHILDERWVKVFVAGTKAKQTFGRKYLILGQMLLPVATGRWTTIKIGLKDEATGKWKTELVEVPAIIQQAYRSPEGKVGWVLVNHTDQGVTCVPEAPLPQWFAELASSAVLRRVTVQGVRQFAGADLKSLVLEPAEVVLVEQQ